MPAGHVWTGRDSGGDELTIGQVKAELSRVRGHLVWMPLEFLQGEALAEPGLQVNTFTQSIYT